MFFSEQSILVWLHDPVEMQKELISQATEIAYHFPYLNQVGLAIRLQQLRLQQPSLCLPVDAQEHLVT